MNKLGKNIATGVTTIFMIAVLVGCQKEGPAERAGKEIDSTMDKAGQRIEKAGEKIQDTAKGDKK